MFEFYIAIEDYCKFINGKETKIHDNDSNFSKPFLVKMKMKVTHVCVIEKTKGNFMAKYKEA